MLSASLRPANAGTVLACLDVIESDPSRIEALWDNAEYMRVNLKRLGYDTGRSNTPIIPLIIGDDVRTVLAWRALADGGAFTDAALPAGGPSKISRLRPADPGNHRAEHRPSRP